MVAKAGLGLIGLSAIGVGGVALAKPGWLGMGENPMPAYHSLASDHEYSSGGYDNNFGGKHKNYLVGVTHKKDSNSQQTNESWWEWSFERLKKDKPDSKKFKHKGGADDAVNDKYSDTESNGGAKALNQVCKSAYKVETSKITSEGTGNDDYKEADVWKYCSFLGEKPKTVADREENTNKYKIDKTVGHDSSSASKLVSTTGNDKFWEIRDKEFKKEDGYGNIEDTTDDFFKKESNSNTTIRDLCEKAYNLEAGNETSTAAKPKKDQVVKYCSLSKE